MMMKKIYILITIAVAALCFATRCANDPITYDGPARVSFAATTASFQVRDEPNPTLTIPVTTTVPFAEATTIKLEVTPGEAGTQNGVQFTCPTSIVLPAGAYSADLVIAGHYDALVTGEKYTFTLALDPGVVTIQGSDSVAIDLARFCPLTMTEFIGLANCADGATASLLSVPEYTVLTEAIPGETHKLQLYGLFLCEPGDAGWEAIVVEFNEENGSISIPAFNAWMNGAYMLRLAGGTGSADVNRPITGTYNACEKKLTFSYFIMAVNPSTGAYLGYYNIGVTTTVISF
jgi:hypothetical protein